MSKDNLVERMQLNNDIERLSQKALKLSMTLTGNTTQRDQLQKALNQLSALVDGAYATNKATLTSNLKIEDTEWKGTHRSTADNHVTSLTSEIANINGKISNAETDLQLEINGLNTAISNTQTKINNNNRSLSAKRHKLKHLND